MALKFVNRKAFAQLQKLLHYNKLFLRPASVKAPQAVFLEKCVEDPVIVLSENDDVDIIGPPDAVSNLRPIIRKKMLNETALQHQLRQMQDATQSWNQTFWATHNTNFIKEREEYIERKQVPGEEKRQLNADEMSEFYKHFLDKNWETHLKYNFEWYRRNFTLLFLAFRRKISTSLGSKGPKLVGPYTPADLSNKKKASTHWLFTHLPASADNIKFFDDLGNSSLTRIYHFDDYVTLKFRTRYPLLGGWKTYYYLQYAVPTHEYLYTSENFYMLEIRAVDYVLDGKVIKNFVVKIVLPEGAQVRNVHLPDGLTLGGDERSCLGGLCVFGRPTIVLNGSHLFEEHIATVKVEYFFDSLYLLRAPFLISCYIQAIFLFVLVGKRFFL